MNFLRFATFSIFLSALLIGVSVAALIFFGLELGIDFTGGSILELEYQERRPSNEEIREALAGLDLSVVSVQPSGTNGVILRMKDISEETHQQILAKFQGRAREIRFASIGSVIGKELKEKTRVVVALSILAIVLYVALAFRRVLHPIQSWHLGTLALLTISHDVVVTLGVLALLGEYQGVQIQIPVVAALLTIIGYTINDTVVVFDRVRENILKKVGFDFQDLVNKSIRETFARSFNTSFTTLLVVFAILFFGGQTLRDFALTTVIGIIVGSYSSLFAAPALLVRWVQHRSRPRT